MFDHTLALTLITLAAAVVNGARTASSGAAAIEAVRQALEEILA